MSEAMLRDLQARGSAVAGACCPALLLLAAAGASLALAGCGASNEAVTKKPSGPASWGHTKGFDDTGLFVAEDDLDQDGRVDRRVITRMKGDPSTKVRVEWDLNHDGATDVWQFFDEHGELTREEYDLDFDGKIDVIQYYEDGRPARKEVATNFQGRMTIRKHFDGRGNLTMIEQDADDDGKLDTWEFYEGGKLVRIGRDTNGDGQEDLFTEPTESYRKKAEEALKQSQQEEQKRAEKQPVPPGTKPGAGAPEPTGDAGGGGATAAPPAAPAPEAAKTK